jgi:shikimate kinase
LTHARPRLQRIWLVGSMGAGKTTVGRALSRELGWPLVDNDTTLEQTTGATAAELADDGAARLHDSESAVLRRTASTGPVPAVVGVAAGVGDRPEDLDLLRRTGTVVYLRARVATLAARLGTGGGRPWLAGDPAEFLAARLGERGPAYESAADLVVDVDERSAEDVASEVAGWWRATLR